MAHTRISSSFFPNQGGSNGFPLGNGKVAMPGFMANIKVIFSACCNKGQKAIWGHVSHFCLKFVWSKLATDG